MSDPKVLPEVILYDPELVATLPVGMTVTSGLNAMAHAAEALYAENKTAVTTKLAMDGLQSLISGLPKVIDEPDDFSTL